MPTIRELLEEPRFASGYSSAQGMLSRNLFPIVQLLRAVVGNPDEEARRYEGFNAGMNAMGNAGTTPYVNSARPWESVASSEPAPQTIGSLLAQAGAAPEAQPPSFTDEKWEEAQRAAEIQRKINKFSEGITGALAR
jgi:hypothetical protein